MQVKLEAMAVHGRHRRQHDPLTPGTSGRICASTSVAITMGDGAEMRELHRRMRALNEEQRRVLEVVK